MADRSRRRILVVDDDEAIRTQLGWQLEADGYDVDLAADGTEAVRSLTATLPDVMVLDLSMPGIAGLDVLRTVRAQESMRFLPVIILSGRSTESDRIVGLDAGADDYLIKPFSPGELGARVRSLLRRTATTSTPAIEGLDIDTKSRDVTVDGVPVDLTAKEFDLLAFLAANPRQVFSRAQLLQSVWNNDGWQSEATVTEHIHRLRNKIEPDPAKPRWLKTVRGVGYRLEP
jgi:DNA-binding response OmpR family regulator